MEVFFIKALQLILCLSLLIVLHEGGHFFFAKLFGVRVEKFCLFFDPWKSWKLFSYKGTNYHLGWLPLGGYVSIAGMVDETTKADELNKEVQTWEFRAKPAWQRLLIMLGGVLVNFIIALFLYAMILFVWGEEYTPVRNMTHGLAFSEQAHSLGFRDGDILLGTDDKTYDRFSVNCIRDLSEAHSATVLRQGKEVEIALPGNLNMLDMLGEQPPFVAVLRPSVVDSILPNSPAAKAGIAAGDTLRSFRGKPITTWNAFEYEYGRLCDELKDVSHADSVRLLTTTIGVSRKGSHTIDTLSIRLTDEAQIGVIKQDVMAHYKTAKNEYELLESIPAGVRHGINVLCGYVDDLKYLFTKKGAQSVGSFGAIGNLFPSVWNWGRFWELTAFISLILAFMNVLPIPALDGGHVFFLLVEVITGRKPSDKFMERAGTIGMVLLLALMAFAIFNDFRNFVF